MSEPILETIGSAFFGAVLAIAFPLALAVVILRYRAIRARLERTVVGQVRDIEERERLYRTVVTRASDGIVLIRDERITFANARAVELVGVAADRIVGQPFIQFVHPDHRAAARENYARRMGGDEAPYRYETALVNAEGNPVPIEASGTAMMIGGIRTNLVLIRDISSRLQAESHQREAARRLEVVNRRLEESTAQARELARRAEEADRSKAEFLANVSCELRTPLSSVLGMTELLLSEAFGSVNWSQREALQSVDESGRHLLDLIGDILDMARLETGQLEPKPVDVDLHDLCAVCMRFIAMPASRKGVNTVVEWRGAPARVSVDSRMLRHILVNLLGNAVKFTPAGGSVALVVSQQPGDPMIDFTVSDTGIGISRERLEAIFEPFESAGRGTGRGVGLGLTMARRLATVLGGTLTARSTPGLGSTFTLRIACSPVSSEPAPAAPATESLLGMRILVAEDEPVSARMLELQLRHAGASVTLVSNGREAVSRARARRPDVVLMDVHMPVMGGIEATSALKGDPLTAGIPVICLTVLAMDEDRDRCLAAGADDFLIKPVEMRALISKLRRQPAGSKKPEDLVGRRE